MILEEVQPLKTAWQVAYLAACRSGSPKAFADAQALLRVTPDAVRDLEAACRAAAARQYVPYETEFLDYCERIRDAAQVMEQSDARDLAAEMNRLASDLYLRCRQVHPLPW